MRRLALLLTVLALSATALVTGFFIDLIWNDRAAYTCTLESEQPAGATAAIGYSFQWEWTEFAYVCRYHAPGEPTKRVGFTDAFP